MADQKRWFKLWHAALSDDDLSSLPPATRWAWAALGAHTKVHGTRGVVSISLTNTVIAAQMGVPLEDLLQTLLSMPKIAIGTAPVRWPHGKEKDPVCDGDFVWGGAGVEKGWKRGSHPPEGRGFEVVKEWCTRHGEVFVTWRNWIKYQEDTTQAKRGAASRSKRRGEESKDQPLPLRGVNQGRKRNRTGPDGLTIWTDEDRKAQGEKLTDEERSRLHELEGKPEDAA